MAAEDGRSVDGLQKSTDMRSVDEAGLKSKPLAGNQTLVDEAGPCQHMLGLGSSAQTEGRRLEAFLVSFFALFVVMCLPPSPNFVGECMIFLSKSQKSSLQGLGRWGVNCFENWD